MPRFEVFSREAARSREEPMFTLQARGLLSLNSAVFRALGEPGAVELLYDAAERIIALRGVDKGDPNAYAVRKQSGTQSYLVATRGFLSFHGIKPVMAQRFLAHDYGEGVWGLALTEGRAVTNRRGAADLPPARTDRWRVTNDGLEVPALMRIRETAFSHPGYMRQMTLEQTPPSMRVGVLVACEPLGPEPATSDLRRRFLSFLDSPPVMDVISSVSHVDKSLHWTPWGGRGRINLEAILVGDMGDVPVAPVASALMLLPEPGMSGFGRDPRFAQLVLHVQPQSAGGGPPKPADIAAWHDRFTRALHIPSALASFLTQGLQLTTVAEPPAQVGIWLNTAEIQQLIDLEKLTPVAGTYPASWFMGWAVADEHGSPAGEVAVELLRQMCDYTLRLDQYEQVLGSLLIQ
jgi:hypothetical protein